MSRKTSVRSQLNFNQDPSQTGPCQPSAGPSGTQGLPPARRPSQHSAGPSGTQRQPPPRRPSQQSAGACGTQGLPPARRPSQQSAAACGTQGVPPARRPSQHSVRVSKKPSRVSQGPSCMPAPPPQPCVDKCDPRKKPSIKRGSGRSSTTSVPKPCGSASNIPKKPSVSRSQPPQGPCQSQQCGTNLQSVQQCDPPPMPPVPPLPPPIKSRIPVSTSCKSGGASISELMKTIVCDLNDLERRTRPPPDPSMKTIGDEKEIDPAIQRYLLGEDTTFSARTADKKVWGNEHIEQFRRNCLERLRRKASGAISKKACSPRSRALEEQVAGMAYQALDAGVDISGDPKTLFAYLFGKEESISVSYMNNAERFDGAPRVRFREAPVAGFQPGEPPEGMPATAPPPEEPQPFEERILAIADTGDFDEVLKAIGEEAERQDKKNKKTFVRLRGSVPPMWFAKYFSRLPSEGPEVKINRDPAEILYRAWKEFDPQVTQPHLAFVVGGE